MTTIVFRSHVYVYEYDTTVYIDTIMRVYNSTFIKHTLMYCTLHERKHYCDCCIMYEVELFY